ncbi:hypothetical protein QFZ79_003141 [Arthrobacter sp. V4I6]|uniref:hypothetical protein n=1 Tax=unclassified Arthrobacter TaxID=235627 RepID=UPI002782FD28|nr:MULTISPECIES: hypothetical protein [unclassified Arthrobacter]MDQ0820768.1 hypothetical protein [Arthrobacter sp. V1I7]MDQ0855030.1 hypothetical protein [Arthrobacter sp. V4I6]
MTWLSQEIGNPALAMLLSERHGSRGRASGLRLNIQCLFDGRQEVVHVYTVRVTGGASPTNECRSMFGDDSRWITAEDYPHRLALAIMDSIFSTGSHFQSVINVVVRTGRTGSVSVVTLTGTTPKNC